MSKYLGHNRYAVRAIFALFLSLPFLALSYAAQQNRSLIVAGHPGELKVVDMGGRSYVEIEMLARLVSGSLSFEGERIVLTLPTSSEVRPVPVSTPPPPVPQGFSKEFLNAGIEEMSDIREWRSTLAYAIQRGFPVTPEWVDNYSMSAQQSLALASVAASTDSDRSAFRLLTNVFNNMKQLSDRFLQLNKDRTYISPDSLKNDPLDQKILQCARSLAAMASSGQFADEASCH